MIEELVTLGLFIFGVILGDSHLLMAAGLFSISCNLSYMVDFMRKKVE